MSNSILVTGGNGFIGKAFAFRALAAGFKVRIAARSKSPDLNRFEDYFLVSNLNSATEWSPALSGIDTIVHCAARVHVMSEKDCDPLELYRKVNVEGTLNLAHQAALSGVKRFIFISSVKVHGESTIPGIAFTENDAPNPVDDYAKSKCEAELGLRRIGSETGLEVVIIRPPLVYGPGVKANFLTMINLIHKGALLPFRGITNNRRSFIYVENLVDMMVACINHPAAANQIFLVSDDDDLSTTALMERMSLALGRPLKLFTIPVSLIKFVTRMLGRPDISQRLCSSLQVDIRKARETLGWAPPVSVDEGLRQTAEYFLKLHS
jgi:nucleoside-diphosphate-sugar epimerase